MTNLEHMRALLVESEAPELLQDRQDVWSSYNHHLEDLPGFWTLAPDESLCCWREVLEGDLKCDFRSLECFVNLVRTDLYGYMEGTRLLYHLIKDSSKSSWRDAQGPAAWLAKGVLESKEAMADKAAWDGPSLLLKKGKGKGKGTWSMPPMGPQERSRSSYTYASSSSWDDRSAWEFDGGSWGWQESQQEAPARRFR